MTKNTGLEKFIHTLLVVYIGIIGPLAYIDSYSPHQLTAQGYQFTFFQMLDRTQVVNTVAELKQLHHQSFKSIYQVDRFPRLTNRPPLLSLASFLQTAMGSLYVTTDYDLLAIAPKQEAYIEAPYRQYGSIYLPPPYRPPRYFIAVMV